MQTSKFQLHKTHSITSQWNDLRLRDNGEIQAQYVKQQMQNVVKKKNKKVRKWLIILKTENLLLPTFQN